MTKLTQNADVINVAMLLLNPGFLPFRATRLYMVSLSHTFVFIFQESRRILKLGGHSINGILTFAAPSQQLLPEGVKPVKPRPVRMLAPY